MNPNRLLLPAGTPPGQVPLTPTITVHQMEAWNWALARNPLWSVVPHDQWRAAGDDFRFHALPPDLRVREENAAAEAAESLITKIHDLLAKDERPGYFMPALRDVPREDVVTALRAGLQRLVAEVEELIGDEDGER